MEQKEKDLDNIELRSEKVRNVIECNSAEQMRTADPFRVADSAAVRSAARSSQRVPREGRIQPRSRSA